MLSKSAPVRSLEQTLQEFERGFDGCQTYLAAADVAELNEVWVRLVLRTHEKSAADGFGRLFPWMGLSGPAYTCGFHGLHNSGEHIYEMIRQLLGEEASKAI